ncbi:MAG: hypothetical protein AB7S38_07620 [Vulcanimicrobiota bacterium]
MEQPKPQNADILTRLATLDRRIIFIVIAFAVAIPIFFPLGLPIAPTKSVIGAYDYTEKLKPGSLLLFSYDYGPSTKVELHPMVLAAMDQVLKKDCKIIGMALYPEGQALCDESFAAMMKLHPDKKYGVDLVNLGYKAGNEGVLVSLGLDFRGLFPVDARGTPLSDIPALRRITRLQDFDLVASYSAGYPGALEHIRLTNAQYGLPLIVGTTAVQTPQYYPYFNSGQLKGLIGGLGGAAEYEKLSGFEGTATSGMDAQSIAHFVIAAFILMANIIYFLQWRDRQEAR